MPKPFPVKHGDGREVGDLSAYMRKLMLDCQQGLQTLLKQDDDLKLKLATIKLILDYGWGRARPMNVPTDDGVTLSLDGSLEAMFLKLGKPYLDANDDKGEPHQFNAVPAWVGEDDLVRDGTQESENTQG